MTLPPWLRAVALPVLLGVSLVLNAVLLASPGAIGAGRGRPGFERTVARIEASLPEQDRPAFRQVMEAERNRYAGPLEAVRQARRDVDAAIGQDPFDPAALRLAMANWSARWVAFNDAFSEALVRAMTAVSPEGRAQVAAARSRHSR